VSPGIPEYRITAIKLGNLTVDASGLVYGQNAGPRRRLQLASG
jgi:hypothetical protein